MQMQCALCGVSLTYNGVHLSADSMVKHLNRHHKTEVAENTDVKPVLGVGRGRQGKLSFYSEDSLKVTKAFLYAVIKDKLPLVTGQAEGMKYCFQVAVPG